MKVDYIAMMQEYRGHRNDGYLTDMPIPIQLAEDDFIRVHYDATAMRWIANRPSRIKYPKAKELIKQIRKEYAERLR